VASSRRGQRLGSRGGRTRVVRVAGAALLLSGAGLTITGVANAATAPALAPGFVIGGPLDGAGGLLGTPSSGATAAPTGAVTGGSTGGAGGGVTLVSPTDPIPGVTASGTTAPPTNVAAPVGGSPSGAPSGSASGTASGRAAPSGGMTQPPARQTLAETGMDRGVPWVLTGALTLVVGGLVLRFGPRGAPVAAH
jgi:hypothetical protein